MKLKNTYFLLRHGQAHSNRDGFVSSWPEKVYNPLTVKGKKQIEKIATNLKKEKIDLIISSDLLRTRLSAEIVAARVGANIKFDKRIREIGFGILNGKKEDDWRSFFNNKKERFTRKPKGGENYRDVKRRVGAFLGDINHQYKNKRILIIAHAAILFSFQSVVLGYNEEQERRYVKKLEMSTGELRKI